MELFTYIILFVLGIFFGSFSTLAVYRIPRGEDILYKHSYCPNCNHKLGVWDLIPVLSYLALRGKCRYCHEKIRIRYLLLEVLSGLVFVLYGYSIHLNIFMADAPTIISLFFISLHFVGLFIIAGIDKERREMFGSVLWYEVIVAIGYIIYICTLEPNNAYIYVIYLSILILEILLDTIHVRKYMKPSYITRVLILIITMLVMSNIETMLFTLLIVLAFYLVKGVTQAVKKNAYPFRKIDHRIKEKVPIGYIFCVAYIISRILIHN